MFGKQKPGSGKRGAPSPAPAPSDGASAKQAKNKNRAAVSRNQQVEGEDSGYDIHRRKKH